MLTGIDFDVFLSNGRGGIALQHPFAQVAAVDALPIAQAPLQSVGEVFDVQPGSEVAIFLVVDDVGLSAAVKREGQATAGLSFDHRLPKRFVV